MTPSELRPWRNPRVILTLLLVFLCGAAAGGLAMKHGMTPASAQSVAYFSEGGKELSLHRLTAELNLTPEQAKRLEVVLDDFVKYYHALQSQMADVRASGKDRILRILDPDQQKKFEQMLVEAQVRPPAR